MSLVSEIIYQLKHQEGIIAVFKRMVSESLNIDSGETTPTEEIYTVRKAIKLENHFRQTLLRALGADKIGYQKLGDFELVIDKRDLPKAKKLDLGDRVEANGVSGVIAKIGDFDAAYVFSVNII